MSSAKFAKRTTAPYTKHFNLLHWVRSAPGCSARAEPLLLFAAMQHRVSRWLQLVFFPWSPFANRSWSQRLRRSAPQHSQAASKLRSSGWERIADGRIGQEIRSERPIAPRQAKASQSD